MKDNSSYSLVEQRIVDLIEEQIYSGKLKPGEKTPSEHELTDLFNASRCQVRHALSLLEKNDLIVRRQGSGTYVREINKKPIAGMTVAIAVNQIPGQYSQKVTSALMESLDAHGVRPVTSNLHFNNENEYRFIHDVHYGGYAGLAIWPDHSDPLIKKMLNSLCEEGIPTVLYDHFFEDIPIDSVCTDNEDIGFRLTEALLQKGCTRLAFVGTEYSKNYSSAQARIKGMVSAMCNNGCSQSGPQIINLSAKYDRSDISPVLKAMAAPQRPDGLLFTYSGIAEAVLPHLKELGWRIGTDLQIAFVDDNSYRKKAGCPVITLEQPAVKIGKEAAKLLLQRIKNPDKPITRKLIKCSPGSE